MKRLSRPLGILGIIVLVMVLLLWAGRRYLASAHGAKLVADRLESMFGGQVRLAEVNVGLRGTALRRLQVFESGDEAAGSAPWVVVEEVDTDVSALDLLGKAVMPQQLTLSGAAVTLRFDEQGRLLTQLPRNSGGKANLPRIRLRNARLTLQQEKRAPLVVDGIVGELAADAAQQLLFRGTVTDTQLGEWTLAGEWDMKAGAGQATLKTVRPLQITQAQLESLPFIPAATWEQVKAAGTTTAEITLRTKAEDPTMHYRVELEPRATRVFIPAIDLQAEQAQGRVLIEDAVVQLRDVRGKATGGELEVSADLNFRDTPERLHFLVNARGLEVRQLPASWKLPSQIEGPLSGCADLQLSLLDGQVQTSGSGEGEIVNGRFAGLPARKMQLRLHADGRGFRFGTAQTGVFLPGALPLLALAIQSPPPTERPPDWSAWPVRAVSSLLSGLQRATRALVEGGTTLVARLTQERKPDPKAEPSYLEASLALDDVDVEQLVRGLGLKLPFALSGRLSFEVQAAIPLDTPRDLKTYRFTGTATVPQLTLEGLRLEQLRARLTYRDGILNLEELRGRVPPEVGAEKQESPQASTFQGTAQLVVIPQGDLVAKLTLDRIALARVLTLIPGAAETAEGALSATITARAPAARLQEVEAWDVAGELRAERLRAFGLSLEHVGLDLRLQRGVLTATKVQGQLFGATVDATAELRLSGSYPFQARVSLGEFDLASLQRLAPNLRPPVALAGRFRTKTDVHGTLSPLALTSAGTGTVQDLKVEKLTIGTLTFSWKSDADVLQLTDLRAALYEGEIAGSATLPLKPAAGGKLELRFKKLDVGALTRDLPAMPFPVEGQADGTLQGMLPAAQPGRSQELTAKVELESQRLRVRGIATDRLQGTLSYREQTVTYAFEGAALGGRFRLNGKVPLTPPKPDDLPPDPQEEGHFRLEKAQLPRLWEALEVQAALGPLQGVVDLDIRFRHKGPERLPVGNGRFTVEGLRWGQTKLAGDIRGKVRLTEHELRLRDLSGTVGQGLLRGQVSLSLRRAGRSWFTFDLNQVEAGQVLAPWPTVASAVQGLLQVRLRGSVGQEWSGTGEVTFSRARVLGAEVAEWRLPLSWSVAPARGRGQIDVRDSSAQVAQGRATGRASFRWGASNRLEGQLNFNSVQLRPLLRQVTDLTTLGDSQVTGRIDFTGNDIRSLDEVTATLVATLGRTQAFEFPVFRQLTPYLMPGQSSGATFQSGELRATLARGIVNVQQLTLQGAILHVFAEGTVTLQGRLDLNVLANTGRLGPNPTILRVLGLRLPPVGPIPLTLLLTASDYLSDRLIRLRVSGTIRSPVVRVDPVALLTDGAVRFFVRQAGLSLR